MSASLEPTGLLPEVMQWLIRRQRSMFLNRSNSILQVAGLLVRTEVPPKSLSNMQTVLLASLGHAAPHVFPVAIAGVLLHKLMQPPQTSLLPAKHHYGVAGVLSQHLGTSP